MNGRASFRLNEDSLARPVLMSYAVATVEAPIMALAIWFGTDRQLTSGSYLLELVVWATALTLFNYVGMRAQRKHFPPWVSPRDQAEVRRIVWLGLPVSRRELAPGVLAYVKTGVNPAFMPGGGSLVLTPAAVIPEIFKTDGARDRAIIVLGVVVVAYLALVPYFRGVGKRVKQARKSAEEVLETRESTPPANASAEGDAV
jgi:hypothetical protein